MRSFPLSVFLLILTLMLSGCTRYVPDIPSSSETPAALPTCLILGSYHDGYAGQDALVSAIASELDGVMQIDQFNMDTKNNPDTEYCKSAALEAKAYIDSHQPDILIAMDDNASKYVVMPYYKDSTLPIVFIGVNWSAESYGYPYSNVTGMIEVHPIAQALNEIIKLMPDATTGSCIYPDTESDAKHFDAFQTLMTARGLQVQEYRIKDSEGFKQAFSDASETDFIMFTNNIGLSDWDDAEMKAWILANTKKLTLSTNPWMSPYVVATFSMDSAEQGRYGAQLAEKILFDGLKPGDIPIVSNRNYNLTLNESLMSKIDIEFNHDILQKALKIER